MFTRELIRNSGEESFKLEKTRKDKETPFEEKVEVPKEDLKTIIKKEFSREKINEEKAEVPKEDLKTIIKKEFSREKINEEKDLGEMMRETKSFKPLPTAIPRPTQIKGFRVPVLRIPQPKLPPRFQYLKPTITERNIDLGELNVLVNDPRVREIESQGPNENVFVSGSMGRKKTGIILSKEEIDEVVNRFSKASKIPTFEGIFKVVVGKLIFSAVISKQVGSKFLIKKMVPPSKRY